MGHDILELESIPRDRKTLAAVIGQARHDRQRARLMQLATVVCLVAGCLILIGTFVL